jgi:hypothetical protein
MPSYQAGDHKIDHPPLFACREHKQFLKLTEKFVKDILGVAADIVPANLSEVASGMLGGNADGFKLPEYLIPPRLVLYNPDFLKGPAALPFTIVFIDKRFVGIPAAYLMQDKFGGCAECDLSPASSGAPARAAAPARPQTGNVPTVRPGSGPMPSKGGPAPAGRPQTGGVPIVQQGAPKRPAGAPAPAARPGTEGSGIIRRGSPPSHGAGGSPPARPAPPAR